LFGLLVFLILALCFVAFLFLFTFILLVLAKVMFFSSPIGLDVCKTTRLSDMRFCSNCYADVTRLSRSGKPFVCPKCGNKLLSF
jgi:hypothetical protein